MWKRRCRAVTAKMSDGRQVLEEFWEQPRSRAVWRLVIAPIPIAPLTILVSVTLGEVFPLVRLTTGSSTPANWRHCRRCRTQGTPLQITELVEREQPLITGAAKVAVVGSAFLFTTGRALA